MTEQVLGKVKKRKLYTAGQAFVCTFLGGVIGATIVFYNNWKYFNDEKAAKYIVIGGILLTVVLTYISLKYDFNLQSLPTALAVSMAFVVRNEMKQRNIEGEEIKAIKQGWWKTIGVGVLSCLVGLAIVYATAIAMHFTGTINLNTM